MGNTMPNINFEYLIFNLYLNIEMIEKGIYNRGKNSTDEIVNEDVDNIIPTEEYGENQNIDPFREGEDEFFFNTMTFIYDGNGDIYVPQGEAEIMNHGMEEIFNFKKLNVDSADQFVNKCAELNRSELLRARQIQAYWKDLCSKYPDSPDIKNIVVYLDKVIGKFIVWYHQCGVEVPVGNGKNDLEETTKKIQWQNTRGWKKKFAILVNEVFENNPAKYDNSNRECARQLFKEYEFPDKNWTVENLYEHLSKY
jgi:hypothetical protein